MNEEDPPDWWQQQQLLEEQQYKEEYEQWLDKIEKEKGESDYFRFEEYIKETRRI
jgi:hypothetical protein